MEKVTNLVSELKIEVVHLRESVSALQKQMSEHTVREETRLRKIEDNLNMAKAVLFTLKAIGLTLIAVLTLKFGDIRAFWAK